MPLSPGQSNGRQSEDSFGYIESIRATFGKPNKHGVAYVNCVTIYSREGRMIRITGKRLTFGECSAIANPEMRAWPLSVEDEARAEVIRRARELEVEQ